MAHRVSPPSVVGGGRALVGMIHVGALPGTPSAMEPLDVVVERAVEEARVYASAGFTALLVENMYDRPYLKGVAGPEIVAAMTLVAGEVGRATSLPLGIQVLAGANREALAVALACGADFVRVEGFVFGHVADEGVFESCAGDLLRYRRAIGAEHVKVLADVKKKHAAHAITADVDLVETARAAEFFLADGVVITGNATGIAASADEVRAVADAVTIPVFVGSGVTPFNVADYPSAHGVVVGSSAKAGGRWDGPLDAERVAALARAFRGAAAGR